MARSRPLPLPDPETTDDPRAGPSRTGAAPEGATRRNTVHSEQERISLAFAPAWETQGYPTVVKLGIVVGGSVALWAGIARLAALAFHR